jgi:hypothetical protein
MPFGGCVIDLATARAIALSFPEVEEHDHRGHPSFRVKQKIVATLWPEEQRAVLKLPISEQSALHMLDPAAFAPVSGGWGRQGWTNVSLALVDESVFRQAVSIAWQQVAPKRLLSQYMQAQSAQPDNQ